MDQGLGAVPRKCHACACVRTCECTWCMHAGTQPYEVPTRAASLDVIPGCLEVEAPCRASGTAVGSSGTAWLGPGAAARIMYASAGNHGYFASGAPRALLLRQCDPQLSEDQSTSPGITACGWGRIEHHPTRRACDSTRHVAHKAAVQPGFASERLNRAVQNRVPNADTPISCKVRTHHVGAGFACGSSEMPCMCMCQNLWVHMVHACGHPAI